MSKGFCVEIPTPPSVNAMYANSFNGKGRGRYKTSEYKAWEKNAAWCFAAAKVEPVKGRFRLFIGLSDKTRGDGSNRIKAVEDLLVKLGLIEDDSLVMCPNGGWAADSLIEKGWARVTVEGLE